MLQVLPDWTHKGTAKNIKEYMKWNTKVSPGLYISNTDTVLVIPLPEQPTDRAKIWNHTWPEDTLFKLHVWNTPIHKTILDSGLIPTRQDKRG